MFTGIIQKTGKIREFNSRGGTLLVETSFSDLQIGESVAVNGICLTVTETTHDGVVVFNVSPETLDRTSLGKTQPGATVNLERALLASTRLSGHCVQGHVDGVGKISAIVPVENGNTHLSIEIPSGLSRYCVDKGSVALDGISLTVNQVRSNRIELMIIPHTWNETHLSHAKVGDPINIEVDILAKYVERLLQCQTSKQL